jgi:hypothetical protein
VVITAAHIDDRQGVVALLTGYFADGVKRLRKVWVDGGYVAQSGLFNAKHSDIVSKVIQI